MPTCARCGGPLPPDDADRGPAGRPSRCRACTRVARRTCVQCGQPFDGSPATTLCSAACRAARRPQTFKTCEACGERFGPVSHLRRKFCGWACKVRAQTTGRTVTRRTHTRARSAHSLLRYHVQAGNIVRPTACEQCGRGGRRIAGAHYTYDEPLRVRWLCVSCHRRWDRAEPKGATDRVPVGPTPPPSEPGGATCPEPGIRGGGYDGVSAGPGMDQRTVRRWGRVTGGTAGRVEPSNSAR